MKMAAEAPPASCSRDVIQSQSLCRSELGPPKPSPQTRPPLSSAGDLPRPAGPDWSSKYKQLQLTSDQFHLLKTSVSVSSIRDLDQL